MDSQFDDLTYQVPTAMPSPPSNYMKALSGLYISGKCKLVGSLYNFVHRSSSDVIAWKDTPIFLLGKTHVPPLPKKQIQTQVITSPSQNGNSNAVEPQPVESLDQMDEFTLDFYSLLWFTYRKDFPPLEPSRLTTDIGWGCMLRTGQMLIAQAIVRNMLNRSWVLNTRDQTNPYSNYRQILRYFADAPTPNSPYSIHNVVFVSKQIDQQHIRNSLSPVNVNRAGEFFTPTRVCKIFKYLLRRHSPNGMTLHVARDGVVYKDKIIQLCTNTKVGTIKTPEIKRKAKSKQTQTQTSLSLSDENNNNESKSETHEEAPQEEWRPVVILIPLRLGAEKVNPVYIPPLKFMLQVSNTLGFIGGKPKQSLYFVGFQDDQVLYLDPHIVRPAVTPDKEFLDTYHCATPRAMPFDSIDPSLALGFYCGSRQDFQEFCSLVVKMSTTWEYPLFTIEEQTPEYTSFDSEEELEDIVVI